MSAPMANGKPEISGFDMWMVAVDRAVYDIAGVSVHDLSDAGYWDAWAAGVSPADMARDALANDDLFGAIADDLFGGE